MLSLKSGAQCCLFLRRRVTALPCMHPVPDAAACVRGRPNAEVSPLAGCAHITNNYPVPVSRRDPAGGCDPHDGTVGPGAPLTCPLLFVAYVACTLWLAHVIHSNICRPVGVFSYPTLQAPADNRILAGTTHGAVILPREMKMRYSY